ncbi:ribosome biogenesis GTPase Der [Methylococcaceae bacterium CS1]|nr:ribosome biogenesis GTPase Der [Methyloprofundus sp.]TXK96748.1 ribosome biogenesis GTPase Der [Methylococcaceae bacterium CS4]TXL01100.1 ribosome biogenesis GTPase Der [Methylococcaceae bacterium CS5]TXL04535.1 ribosome biogenesis GTPase Der [Methylococcaceae bacterium CS3]TXL04919.1 ribosome biogenesis GTPase Der [Methylococcaceae bacterium CS1]TXL10613.1 ribosome biogenesis GTPase Der [Methylococcaceae bacterium CS2]
MTLPVIALVGRPNVGKSTLFNYLTRTRDALVADYPGLTRDRKYGRVKRGEPPYLLVDTGGITDDVEGIDSVAKRQVQLALEEADVVLFLVDAREGLNSADEAISVMLRKLDKPVVLVTNKIDGINAEIASADFFRLGIGDPVSIAATHGRGVNELLQRVSAELPEEIEEPGAEALDQGVAIAVVGRPNVGKSTLVNRLLGEERVVVFDEPGTTRDSVYIPFERDGKKYTLIDTAGMRRRAKVTLVVEKFSIIKALQSVEKANVVIYLIDASEGITDQDAHLLGMVLDAGRALIIGFNKWDGLDFDQRELIKRQTDVKLPFLDFAEKHPISALHGSGVGTLFDVVHKLYDAAMVDMSTSVLTQILKDAVAGHQPSMVNGRRIKLKYAHQGGRNPPIVVVHGNQTDLLPAAYERYLINYFRNKLRLEGTPIRIVFKSPKNPFKEVRNKLSDRQLHKKKRLMEHHKKKKIALKRKNRDT